MDAKHLQDDVPFDLAEFLFAVAGAHATAAVYLPLAQWFTGSIALETWANVFLLIGVVAVVMIVTNRLQIRFIRNRRRKQALVRPTVRH